LPLSRRTNSLPQPALVAFLADNTPHCIPLGFTSSLNGHRHFSRVESAEQSRVDRLQRRCFLPALTQHCSRTVPQHPRRIAHATGIEAPVNARVLHLRQAPAVVGVEQKTACGTHRVLAQVTLCTAACFAPFDSLLAMPVRTVDCDEGHGPLLALGRCQDETQCGINLSPSPLLEHYHRAVRGTS